MRKTLSVLFSTALALAMLPAAAFAAPMAAQAATASGTWGTCPWEISADGVLTVHPGEGADTNGTSPWEDYKTDITEVIFKAEGGNKVIAPADCSSLMGFSDVSEVSDDYSNVCDIDFSGLDTSRTTNMSKMFSNCVLLSYLDLTPLDTRSVTDMSYMFENLHSLMSLDLTPLDTSSVTNMSGMFSDCGSSWFDFLDPSPLDTRSVTDMSYMFAGCSWLKSLDLSSFDTSNVTTMFGMFTNCAYLVSVDLSSFDTRVNTDMTRMFWGCLSLSRISVGPKTLTNLYLPNETDIDRPEEFMTGNSDWYSTVAGVWFSPEQISAQRKGIADTYTKSDAAYRALEVSVDVYEVGSGLGVAIRFDGPFDKFVQLTVNGRVLDKSMYSVRSGSTVVEIPEATVASLGAGAQDVTALYFDGATATARFTVKGASEPVGTQAMYRLYNPNSGEHFYTASTIERDSVIAAGWNDEGVGWTAPTQGIQVYRLYNSYAGEHHYTTSAEERDMLVSVGWTWEDGGWFSDPDKAVPLYRAYNPNAFANNHHYTTDRGEFETLLSLGWQDEGIGWHGVK
jgi:surface protein